jgi:hypothetical protein
MNNKRKMKKKKTVGSTSSSVRGKQKYSPKFHREILAVNQDSKSRPSRGIGVSGATKKE